jgi:hypothetical protein
MAYIQRLENFSHQPDYHADNICGSSFHGLASTLQSFAKINKLREASEQIKRCIDARQREMNKRSYADPAHNRAIESLNDLYRKFIKLQRHYINYSPVLSTTNITFDDDTFKFSVVVGGMELSPDAEDERGGNIKKIIRKSRKISKSRKNKKTRKGGSRRRLKRSKRHQ